MSASSAANQQPTTFTISDTPLPSSKKIYVKSERFQDVRVAMREIELTGSADEPNLPVYDTSGPYTDQDVAINIRKGLPQLRQRWIEGRGDVESYDGREVKPEDNGFKDWNATPVEAFPDVNLRPNRA